MKNLKKTLSMVLVIAMMVGILVTGAGAAFTDADDIQYTEAVDVMSAMGIISGYDDGSFRSVAPVTREQAAKMICYAILGKTIADSLSVTTTPFSDVPATWWSAPYVSFCVTQGIIVGYGDGTFGPTDPVTAYQLAKMLLVATGYGQNGEFVGEQWEIKTAILAQQKGIFTGSNAESMKVSATREEAALYIFNAMTKIDQVKFSKDTSSYVTAGLGTLAGALGLTHVAAVDLYQRPGMVYKLNGVAITTVATSVPVMTFTTGTTAANLATQLTNAGYTFGVATAPIALNGAATAVTDITGVTYGNGVLVEAYANPVTKVVTDVVVVNEYFGTVTNIVADVPATVANESALELTLSTGDVITATPATAGFAAVYAAAVKNVTKVIATPVGAVAPATAALTVAAPDTVRGIKTAATATYLKVDGTSYNIAGNAAPLGVATFANTCDFYLDSFGNIIGVAEYTPAATAPLTYVYVADSLGANLVDGGTFGVDTPAYAKASIINLDGTTKVVDLPVFETVAGSGNYFYTDPTGGAPVALAGAGVLAAIPAGFYSYTVDANGKYTFTDLDATKAAAAAADVTVTLNSAIVAGTTKLATSATALTIAGGATYNGIANWTTTTFDVVAPDDNAPVGYSNVLFVYTGALLTNIYVLNGTIAAPPVTPTYAYYVGTGELTGAGQYYNFYVNGELKSYLVNGGAPVGDVFTIVVGTDGKATVVDQVLTAAATVDVLDSTFLSVDDGATVAYFNTGYKVFNVAIGGLGVADTISLGDTVSYVLNGGKIDVVYITVNA